MDPGLQWAADIARALHGFHPLSWRFVGRCGLADVSRPGLAGFGINIDSNCHCSVPCELAPFFVGADSNGLAENGGDPSQEGCFFEVDDVEAAFSELRLNGLDREDPGYRTDQHGETSYRVFFVVAPDGLCYCLGQRQS